MALNGEVKSLNGHAEPVRATDTRLAVIERRLAEVAEKGEQRAVVLNAEFISEEMAERDREIAALKKTIADLEKLIEQKTAVDQQVAEVAKRLDAQASARDEAKRGPKGKQGERGARGEKGPPGPRGAAGKRAIDRPVITVIKADAADYRLVPFQSDGRPASATNLQPMLVHFLEEGDRPLVDQAIDELRAEIKRGSW